MNEVLPQRPATRRGFEIAIICALVHEADAVEALFDHYWDDDGPPYDKATGDPNAYTTGAIGRHNVVLAWMPAMGKASAAAVAANCRASFPNIRLAVIVGVCGAVPFTRDGQVEIVLGDVIISDGVIQYDLGRRLPERFVRKDTLLDSLGRPNMEIRSLLTKLKGFRGRKTLQKKAARYLAVVQQEPALAAQHPGVENDRLFHATYRHVTDGKLCNECGCNGPLVQRNRLNGNNHPFAVHFGLLASGDTVLRSGEDSDTTACQEGVIAFEMEGAGVWDTFPCVVIKGVCDYADSHKMKAWQHYAAATAAACMKAFLDSWIPKPPLFPESQPILKSTARVESRVIMLPFLPNSKFTGQEAILEELERRLFVLHNCRTLAITGLGGVGKTQVVLRFAYWIKDNQSEFSVFWVPAYSEESFSQAYMEIARSIGISIKTDDKDLKATVRNYLSSTVAGKWVLIVDNADNAEMMLKSPRGLREYLPQSESGLTILTTRSPDVAVSVAEGSEIHLEEMGIQDATDLLRTSLSRKNLLSDSQQTTMLLGELTYLPLAITQAAAYLNRNRHLSIDGYLKLLRGTGKDITSLLTGEFQDSTRYRVSQNAVATTWIVSSSQIQDTDPAAARLLSFISCIEPRDIPRSILPTLGSDEELEHAIGTLSGYSFLVAREESGIYDMHRLVHLATRVWLKSEGRVETATASAIQHLEDIFPKARPAETQDRSVWQAYLPHAFRLLDISEGFESDERYNLCFKVGRCLYTDRRFKNAVPYFESVSRWRARHLKDEDERRLSADHWLGGAYTKEKRFQEAIEILERVVSISKQTLHETDQSRLDSEHELAGAYLDNGRIQKAIEILEHKVAVQKTTLHKWDLCLLESEQELARAYIEDNRTKTAVEILEHVVEVERLTRDATSHFRLATEHELARAYSKDGQVQKAVDLFEDVVKVWRASFDETDPDRLTSEYELAKAYLKNGQNRMAVDLLEHVVTMESQCLDGDDPNRKASLDLLEYAYQRLRTVRGVGRISL